ncbi:DUF4445 domain-containing protein, partial [Candidatus Sumerlaeota bacterium]|nr:DUF4445 domain-containing protein [Candidatus Sumerlaeota bacterium]
MSENEIILTILPEKREITAPCGSLARDVLVEHGIFLTDFCGGEGKCGKCRIRFIQNPPAPTLFDEDLLSTEEIRDGFRLACKSIINNSATIFIPEQSRVKDPSVLINRDAHDEEPEPVVKKVHLNLEPASLENQASDLGLVRSALNNHSLVPDMEFLKKLPRILRDSGYSVTKVILEDRLIDIEPGDTTLKAGKGACGIAFDLGTTTIAGVLYQLETAEVLARMGRLNPQSVFGADVISRINFALHSPQNEGKLRESVSDCLNSMIKDLCSASGIEPKDVYYVTLAGNTTMQYLFLGIPTDYLPVAPYVPVHTDGLSLSAKSAGLIVNPAAGLYVFPAIGGFVGGDTVADILITDIASSEKPEIIIDIGTNGEIVLGNRDILLATSTAAGPAFEGRNISCGMRAEEGAVDRVIIEEDIIVHTIGESPPRGMCGSGLVSMISELLRMNLIDLSGRFSPNGSSSSSLIDRFVKTDAGWKFLFASKAGGAESDLYLLQKDVRELQLAKAAIAAGVKLLLKDANFRMEDVQTIFIAGAFGNYIDPAAALRLGLIPGANLDIIKFIGNAALSGSSRVLLRKSSRLDAEHLSRKARFVELAGRKDFQDVFAESMLF